MDGYVTEQNEKRVANGEEVEIVTYQGEHCDEYLVRDVKSGRCSLFYKGIVQMSWKEVNEVKVGGFTVYEKGKALRSEDWKELGKKERLFCMIAYLPKATVQAAIGSVPLSMGLSCGKIVLSVAVLAILITAPLGALGMDATYRKLLENNTKPRQLS